MRFCHYLEPRVVRATLLAGEEEQYLGRTLKPEFRNNRKPARKPMANSAPADQMYGVRASSKLGITILMLYKTNSTMIDAMCEAIGWQAFASSIFSMRTSRSPGARNKR